MRASVLVLAGLLSAGLAACSEPDVAAPQADEGIEAPAEVATPEPERDALVAVVGDLIGSLERARDLLLEAAEAPQATAGRRAAQQALAHLVADAGRGSPGSPPVFPSVTSEQRGGSGEASDALTLALTAASDAGGSIGRNVADALRDPLAGDLGAWQRDPAGQFALAQTVAADAAGLAAQEQAIFALPGDGTRAIAWTVLTTEASSSDDLAAYAERGATHLDFVLDALHAAIGRDATTEEPLS